MIKILFDFDGVVNISQRQGGVDYSSFELEEVPGMGQLFFNPKVIAAINSFIQDDDADFTWLTTWEDITQNLTSIGILNAPYESMGEGHPDSNWKTSVIADNINNIGGNYEAVVWIDDDSELIEDVAEIYGDTPGFHILPVNPSEGLTDNEIEAINKLLP